MKASRFSIQTARSAEDIDVTGQLFAAYAASLNIDLAYQDFATELASLPGKYAPHAGALLLARGPGAAPMGCVALRPLPSLGSCEMKRLYVAPEARGHGLGAALVDAILREAVRIGYRDMRLDTIPALTAALALYRRAGFVPIAPYYETPVAGTIFLDHAL